MSEFYIGQKLKNAPNDNEAMFEIVKIFQKMPSDTVYYRVKNIHTDSEFVIHDDMLYPL